jgi:hypothetical protein
MMDWLSHRPDPRGRLARVERMIEQYRFAKRRRLERRALALWRKLEARQALGRFEQPLERVH